MRWTIPYRAAAPDLWTIAITSIFTALERPSGAGVINAACEAPSGWLLGERSERESGRRSVGAGRQTGECAAGKVRRRIGFDLSE
jgi:hypothetical protein